MTRPRSIRRGLVAGFLAGSTVAAWFLAIDIVAGVPLRTPDFLVQILFGVGGEETTIPLIIAYTVLHYAVFLMLGIITARVSARLPARASLPVGLVVGFLLFDLIFYGSLLVTGVNVLDALGWPAVLAGNLLAGITLLEYLRLSAPARSPGWRAILREHPILRKGVVAGLLGASAVAITFLIIDLIFRQALFTPAALGSALLQGAASPTEIQILPSTVLGYTVIHFAAFLGVGLIAANLLARAEDHPGLILGFVLVLITSETLFIGVVAIFAAWILDTIGWWNVLIGNIAATLTMTGYLAYTHPAIWRLLRKGPVAAPQ